MHSNTNMENILEAFDDVCKLKHICISGQFLLLAVYMTIGESASTIQSSCGAAKQINKVLKRFYQVRIIHYILHSTYQPDI